MSRPDRTVARRDPATAAWFDALRDGRLLLRACRDGHVSRPDVLACDICGATDLGWQAAGGQGVVVCLAVDHSTEPATQLAVVELAEGPWLLTRVEGAPVERGAAVVVEIVHPVDGEPYPVVVPARSGSAGSGAQVDRLHRDVGVQALRPQLATEA